MKITDRMKNILTKLKSYLQNGKESRQCKMKERKQLDYLCRNKLMVEYWRQEIEEKKAVITFYSDTSPAIAPKCDEHQYCSKDVATHGATDFTSLTRGSYKRGGDIVVYTNRCDWCSLVAD